MEEMIFNTRSSEINELAQSLAKAQGQFISLEKNAINPYGRGGKPYSYTDLAEYIKCTKAGLSENNLSVVQLPQIKGNEIVIETILLHGSGQWIANKLEYSYEKSEKAMPKIQEMGGTITYLRKYAFSAIVNITGGEDDTDGSDIKEPTNGKQQEKSKPQTRKEEPKKTYTAPPTPSPAKTETHKETQKTVKEDSNIKERVQSLWNRTKVFHTKDEFAAIVKEKWNVEKLMDMTEQQLTEWAAWVQNLEIKAHAKEQKEREVEQCPDCKVSLTEEEKKAAAAPLSTPAQTENPDSPWNMARPGQIEQIEKLIVEMNWTKERKIQWWETYRKTHKIETTTFSDLTNTQASSLVVYLENKLREEKLSASLNPPSTLPPATVGITEEEARKINEENLKLAMEDKVPF